MLGLMGTALKLELTMLKVTGLEQEREASSHWRDDHIDWFTKRYIVTETVWVGIALS